MDDPKGTIYSGNRAFTIYTNDQLTQAKAWNDVIVAYRNDGPLRVSDIGQAVDGPQDTTQAAWADGKRAVFLVIYKQPGANVIDTVDKIMAELLPIKASMPPSIDIGVLSDRTQTICASVHDVHHPAPHDRAGRGGDIRLPTQPMGDDHLERDGAAFRCSARSR